MFKDRVVDDLNPVLNFTRKEVESLLHFVEEEADNISLVSREEFEEVIHQACQLYPHLITKVRFHDRIGVMPRLCKEGSSMFKYRYLLTYLTDTSIGLLVRTTLTDALLCS